MLQIDFLADSLINPDSNARPIAHTSVSGELLTVIVESDRNQTRRRAIRPAVGL